ncbi:MAG: hypothetical protein ABIO39_01960 [Caulobacteraceae bacterium]
MADSDIPNLPVPFSPPEQVDETEPAPPRAKPAGPGVFTAHVLGQDGRKRGLRGGQPVIEAARSAYLEAEYSGPNDRRPPKGLLTRTKI